MDPAYDGAFQGAPGAYSEAALLAVLGSADLRAPRLLACQSLDLVFDAVESGRAQVGVVPVENTLAGSVQTTYDLLLERDLRIVDEHILAISHSLIGPDGAQIDELRRVLSHPVALAQCRRFFTDHPQIQPIPAYDTAGAVAAVVASDDRTTAAIGSARSAEIYGGTVLAEALEDDPENFTRFVAIVLASEVVGVPPRSDRTYGTSLVMTLANRPGALVAALAHFADRGVDLSMIESRPRRGMPFQYAFYLDVAGIADDKPLVDALAALRADALSVGVLGSYPRAASGERRGR